MISKCIKHVSKIYIIRIKIYFQIQKVTNKFKNYETMNK